MSEHAEHHAALKAEYDARHPDSPLPTFGDGEGPGHAAIHELLHLDAGLDEPMAHIEHHNALAVAFNARALRNGIEVR